MSRVISYNNKIISYNNSILNESFDPSVISGLQIWVKADAGITLNSGNVSIWANQSNSGSSYNFTQSASTAQPLYVQNGINGLPSVRFNGTNQTLYQSVNRIYTAGQLTFFVCMKIENTGLLSVLGSQFFERDINGSGAIMYGLYGQSSGYAVTGYDHGGEQVVVSNNLTIDKWYIISNQNINGQSSVFYRNGVNIGTANGSDSNIFQNIGSSRNYTNTMDMFLNGDISEILIYNAALSSNNITNVNNYLNAKYGIY